MQGKSVSMHRGGGLVSEGTQGRGGGTFMEHCRTISNGEGWDGGGGLRLREGAVMQPAKACLKRLMGGVQEGEGGRS